MRMNFEKNIACDSCDGIVTSEWKLVTMVTILQGVRQSSRKDKTIQSPQTLGKPRGQRSWKGILGIQISSSEKRG